MLSIGIVGLPNVGKSSLFKALTRERIEIANYPFTTIDPHKGIVKVPDDRLEKLAAISKSKKVVPAAVEFVDIAGLVKGANEGAGLGNQFLSHIREVDAIAEVVRAFEDPDIAHTEGGPDPVRDIKLIQTELALADLSMCDHALEKARGDAKSGEKLAVLRVSALEKMKQMLETKERISLTELSEEERLAVKDIRPLTAKPLMIVLNVDENAFRKDEVATKELRTKILNEVELGLHDHAIIPICSKIEAELAEMPPDETAEYKKEFGITEDALAKIIRRGYELLGLITFLTTGEDETRAWQITHGSTAPEAGRAIHSDFEEKFIKAEVVPAEELITIGSFSEARTRGKVRTEGKEYIVQDGDVIEFKI